MIKINKKVTNQGVRGAKEGGITTQEAPINVSNVPARRPGDQEADARRLHGQRGRQRRSVSRATSGKEI